LKKLLLATNNEGKRRELQDLFSDLSLEIISLKQLKELPEAVEDGDSFQENARKKAKHYFALTHLPAVADDSGLAVEALGGEPGIHSARYASTDRDRNQKLLQSLKKLDPSPVGDERRAHFICAVCMILDFDRMIEVEARVEGQITEDATGKGGFGYDPVFYYPPLNKTFAELSPDEKNRVSHRGKAFQKLRQELVNRSLIPKILNH
jgi:XTP/dITP diphosphohydrolase